MSLPITALQHRGNHVWPFLSYQQLFIKSNCTYKQYICSAFASVICSWKNESYLPLLPSYKASLHFTVLISCPIEGRRLSWPGWLGYTPRQFVCPKTVGIYPSIDQARRTLDSEIFNIVTNLLFLFLCNENFYQCWLKWNTASVTCKYTKTFLYTGRQGHNFNASWLSPPSCG